MHNCNEHDIDMGVGSREDYETTEDYIAALERRVEDLSQINLDHHRLNAGLRQEIRDVGLLNESFKRISELPDGQEFNLIHKDNQWRVDIFEDNVRLYKAAGETPLLTMQAFIKTMRAREP